MLRYCVVAVFALLSNLPGGALAQSAAEEIRALRQQIRELSERLDALESARPPADRHTTASAAAPAAAAVERDASLDWARRLSFKGDLRYRHEMIDEQGLTERTRQRLRARLGVEGRLSDDVAATLQLASGGSDPRSTNQTLDDNASTKDVGFDLAYVAWRALPGTSVYAGKMKHPFHRPGESLFFDNDVNPEGLAVSHDGAGWFASGYGFWIEERGSASDSTLLGAQFGIDRQLAHGMLLKAGVSYFDYGAVQGRAPFFEGDPFGNSVDAAGNLISDYDLVEIFGELDLTVGDTPLQVYADFVNNTEADDLDTGFNLGVVVNPGPWQLGYGYMNMERDAVFAQVVDSDFGGGQTDSRGHVLRAVYEFGRHVTANLSLFINEIDVDVGARRDYDRLQLDVNFKL